MKKTIFLTGLIVLLVLGTIVLNVHVYYTLSKHIDTPTAGTIPTESTSTYLESLENALITSIKKTSPAVVNIVISKDIEFYLRDPFDFWAKERIIKKKTQIGGGSGIIVAKNGLIITNKHVVEDIRADYSVILNDGTIYKVQHIWFDPSIDIAVLQVVDAQGNTPTRLTSATFSDFKTPVQIGQFAIAIGNALAEYQNTVSWGIISATNRQLESQGKNIYVGLYQTDTPINPGNSGGPLLDILGNVIGMTTAINSEGASIGFALPMNKEFIQATIQSIQNFGKIIRPFIGIEYVDLNIPVSTELGIETTEGGYIKSVGMGSPGEKAGLQAKDIIIAVQGNIITPQLPFLYHIYQFLPGEEVDFTIVRNGGKEIVSVVLGQK